MARNGANPLDATTFGPVARTIRKRGAVQGWRKGRDICLEKWDVLKDEMPPYAVLKLAIEMDRHALYCEVAADRARSQRDADVYADYQRYLAGETEVAPAAGVHAPPITVNGPNGDHVEVERESPHGEGEA